MLGSELLVEASYTVTLFDDIQSAVRSAASRIASGGSVPGLTRYNHYLVATTEPAALAAIQHHAKLLNSSPLSYEAVTAVTILMREGSIVIVPVYDGHHAASFVVLVPKLRSDVAGRMLTMSGLHRVVDTDGQQAHDEWVWW